nr:c-type cytochrome [Cytophagales bacterium]
MSNKYLRPSSYLRFYLTRFFLVNRNRGIFLLFLILLGCKPPIASYPGIFVPEGFFVEKVADEALLDFPMFATFDETGRLFVFESTGNVYEESDEAIRDPQFRIKLLEDTDSDGVFDKSTVFADKVGFPQGGVFYKGSLYASSAPDLLKFTDTTGDGIADQREVILSGWTLNVNANSLVGPFMGPDGWLYMTNAIMGFDVVSQEGVHLKGETSRLWRVRPDGSGLGWVGAGGMNNPVEVAFTPSGEPIGTMTYFTNPQAGQRDALIYWTEGGVYPKPNKNVDRDGLPRTGDYLPVIAKYSRVSPAGIGRFRHSSFGEDYVDNLFSAQFNTHQVVRHRLIRDGASFRTEDEVFFKMEGEDYHPTDVLEDADGSLLVVETGGWFIKGCPLSQVSKPELKGGIYRIRKKGAPSVADPYGNGIAWDIESIENLANFLQDPRPFVRDRAEQALVDRGSPAIPYLTAVLEDTDAIEAKTLHALFALYKIGGSAAMKVISTALVDHSEQVKVAAAHAIGLSGDASFSKLLAQVVMQDSSLAVRRQAASALGHLRQPEAVPSLVQAAVSVQDRMLEHAIIHALIQINAPEKLVATLDDTTSTAAKVALIALDQMPAYRLAANQLLPFFKERETVPMETIHWIASRHPEWAPVFAEFVAEQLRTEQLTEERKTSLGQLLIAFIAASEAQQVVGNLLSIENEALSDFLLSVINQASLDKFPEQWMRQLARILQSETSSLHSKVLKIIQARQISILDPLLTGYANDSTQQDLNRMAAMLALNSRLEELPDWQLAFLVDRLSGKHEAAVRQQAAYVLDNGKISDEQLLFIADRYLEEADDFILPRMLPLFAGERPERAGRAIAQKLLTSQTLDSYNKAGLERIFSGYGSALDADFHRIMRRFNEVNASRLEKIESLEALVGEGNLDRGRSLYFGKAACASCHTVGREGGTMGPDLTSIQRDRSTHDILEAIVYPSASFVREYETYLIKTQAGAFTGIIKEANPEYLILSVSPQQVIRIAQADIQSKEILDVSMMPQGLDQLLTSEEMADLMAFLLGQDQNPDTDQQFLR